jgi:hypothetical protein
MRILKLLQVSAFLLGAALAPFGFAGGCSDESRETGTQVKVDEKEQEDLQNRMREAMSKKKAAGKAPRKSP